MKGINQVILAGTVIGDTYTKKNRDGKINTKVTICVEREAAGGNIFKDYFNVQFFGEMAERAEKNIKDRMFVNIVGRLNKRTYNTEDEKKHVTINITGEDFLICIPSEISNAYIPNDKRKPRKSEEINENRSLEDVAMEEESPKPLKAKSPVLDVDSTTTEIKTDDTSKSKNDENMSTIGEMLQDQASE